MVSSCISRGGWRGDGVHERFGDVGAEVHERFGAGAHVRFSRGKMGEWGCVCPSSRAEGTRLVTGYV